jgi:hypothetical protein
MVVNQPPSGPLPIADPNIPGLCFLRLVHPTHHIHCLNFINKINPTVRQVQVYFDQFPGNFAQGYFVAQIGTAYGVSVSLTRHVAIHIVSGDQSRLTAKLVLEACPPAYTIGGLTETEQPVVQHSPQTSLPIPSNLIASANPNATRPLFYVVSACETPKEEGTGKLKVISPSVYNIVRQATNFWSVVSGHNLSVVFTPAPLACGYHCKVYWAWIPSTDAVPNSVSQIQAYPNAGYMVLAPSVPGGFWTAPPIRCPNSGDMLTSLIKPVTQLSAFPSLVVYTEVRALPGQAFVSEQCIFDAAVSMDLSIGF